MRHQTTGQKNLREICMTSNGIGFEKKAIELKKQGLNSVTFSLDSLHAERVRRLTGLPVLKKVMNAIQSALDNSYEEVKINCVVMRDFNDDELCEFARLTKSMPVEVRFIEYMPFGGNRWDSKKLVSYAEMLDRIRRGYPELQRVTTCSSSTAKLYRVGDWPGRLGFITSMTENFCAACTRIRLTADGHLKTCLHGTDEVSLVKLIRETPPDEADVQWMLKSQIDSHPPSMKLTELICQLNSAVDAALMRKAPAHAGMHVLATGENRSMIRIGG